MPFNFFALIKENNVISINRVALGNPLQVELSGMFEEQKNAFLNDATEVVAFDGQYKPEHDEVLAIGGFELPNQIKDAIDHPMTLQPLHFNEDINKKIVAIFCGSNRNGFYEVLAQMFEGARLIKPNMMNIIFGANNEFQKLDYFGMTLDSKLTAYYFNNQLHFKSYHFARRIFDLSGYYREATNQEVMALANHDHFAPLNQDEFLGMADHVVRQTIARIQRNNVLQTYSVQFLSGKAAELNLALMLNEDEKIVLPRVKKDLKLILSFLDDQVFLGPITGQTRVSNSSKFVVAG